ncbi:MAG: M20 family peptidase [Clostridia bacterium]|nr:M20 family peptidase [Clostridia bacterium]
MGKTLRFRPAKPSPVSPAPVTVDRERAVENLAAMIRCKTVSSLDESRIDWTEFERFEALLKERYPLVHATARKEKVGRTGLLYCVKGASSTAPTVLMSHYDVVPAEEENWTRPPFGGLVEDGCLWGRGTLDTKVTLMGILEALETLLAEGYRPRQDLYLAFSGQEEIAGEDCPAMVALLRERGISPALVLDEGGAVVEQVFPGVTQECALIGVAEKGSANIRLSLASSGGHASTPPPVSTLGRLSRALVAIEENPFPRQMTAPVREMLDTLGRHSTPLYRMIFANQQLFAPLLDLYCRRTGGELNAMLRTTVAPTRFEGSRAYNVMPPAASFGVNVRLLGEDTVESVVDDLKRIVDDEEIVIEPVEGSNPSNPSPASRTDSEGYRKLTEAIRQTWPEALVSPYLMMAGSDSRHYCAISDSVYRFSAMRLSKEERAMIHGNDERVPVETLVTVVAFYQRLLRLV